MPDFSNFAVTRTDAANINVPTHRFVGTLLDSGTGATLADYTGPNALAWPSVLSTLTIAQQDEIANQIAMQVMLMKAGL
jgi:hypothetical protein